MNRQTYLWTGQAQDSEQVWPGFTAAGLDHEDILLAFAPRPVRVLAVTSDFFPIEGTRRTVERSRRFWEMLGKQDDLTLVEDQSVHKYTDALAHAAADFFSRHLLGRPLDPGYNEQVAPVEPKALWCTRSGQLGGEIDDAEFVAEANEQRLGELLARRKPERERALRWLRDRVFAQRRPCDLNPRFYHNSQVEEAVGSGALWWSQEGIFNHGILFRHVDNRGKTLPVTVAIWEGGARNLRPHWEWIRTQIGAARAVMVVDLSGMASLAPHVTMPFPTPTAPFAVIHKLVDDLLFMDDDLASLRTFDMIRALDMARLWPNVDAAAGVACYAHGRYGVYGQLAAALYQRIQQLQVVGGIGSYAALVRERHYDSHDAKSLVVHGILQHLDLPDLMGWVGDRVV